jgi:uncharacterized protein YllA (UPF0747 family)
MTPEALAALRHLRDNKATTVKTFDEKFAEVKPMLTLHITQEKGKVYLNDAGKTVLEMFKEQE